MLKLSSASHQWPSNFLFPANKVPSNGLELEERQKLAKLIFDIGVQLCIPSHCIYTAIVYMHRFLTIQPPKQYYTLRVCQASIFLACKCKGSIRSTKDVYKYTAKVLNAQISESPNVVQFHTNAILDYEDLLLSTLGLGISMRHPHEYITEIIDKIRDQTQALSTQLLEELTNTACYLAKQSILLTAFCVRYSVNLIAHFCIQLAIEMKSDGIKSTDWTNKLFNSKEIQILINEFSVMYIKCPDIYKKRSADKEEYELYKILHKKASSYVDVLERKPVTLALITSEGFVPPSSSASNTDEQKSSVPVPVFATTSSAPYHSVDSYQYTKSETSSINPTSTKSEQADRSTENKRRYDSTTDDPACKRSAPHRRKE